MRIKPTFELIEVAGEYMLVPVGDSTASFRGILTLNDAAGFLLDKLNTSITKDQLVDLLMGEYKIDQATAEADIDNLLKKLFDFGVIEE